MKNELVNKIRLALDQALKDELDSTFFTELYLTHDDELLREKLLGEACDYLNHYVTDTDIRNEDETYNKDMKEKLVKYCHEIDKHYCVRLS